MLVDRSRIFIAGVIAVLCAGFAAAQDFQWSGDLAPGTSVEIKGVNGDVTAFRSNTGGVEVTATKEARKSNPDDVRIEVVEHADGVTICAVYPTPEDAERENRCEPGRRGNMSTRNNDVQVHFRVAVPDGVDFVGKTVNGDVSADSIPSNVAATTVNGDVDIKAAGYVEAKTVNGDITARVGQANWEGEVEFKTVNGDITLHFDSRIDADFEAQTVNGSIKTDLPVEIKGRYGPKKAWGTLGAGGRRLSAQTVNGSIEIAESN